MAVETRLVMEGKPARRKIDRIREGAGMLPAGAQSDGAVVSAEGINHRLCDRVFPSR